METDGEFTAEALQRLTKNYEEDSDEEIALPIAKRLSLSDDGESSVDIHKILSSYTSSPPAQNNQKDSENNTNNKTTAKKTRKRAPSVTKESNNNKITNYIKSNTSKSTAKTSRSKKSKTTNSSLRYGIDDLLAENERYKSHQHEKHRALNELRRMDDDSDSNDSDVEMQVHNVLLEKDGDVEERKQALKSHQKLQKLIEVSQEVKESERKDQLFTKNWRKKTLELTPLPFEKKELAPDCILFTGTVSPFEKVINRSLKYLVNHEPFLKSDHFISWLLQICCHSDSPDLIWAAHETLIEVLNNDPDQTTITFQLIVDLLSDFGADMEAIGLGNLKEGSNNAVTPSVELELADIEMVDIENQNWEWSVQFPLFNLQTVLDALSILIQKDLCELERDQKYALLGICYRMTLDTKAFKLLPELQRVMESLYISLHSHNELTIADVIKHMYIESTNYRTLVQCINMTPYGTPLTRFVRQNLAAAALEAAMGIDGIQYYRIGNEEIINFNTLIKSLKSIKVEQGTTNYDELLSVVNFVELAISVHYEQFAKHVDSFTKLHTTLQALSSQIKDMGGLYTAGTVLKEFIVYLCSKIILMKNGYAKQQGRQSFMQEYLTS